MAQDGKRKKWQNEVLRQKELKKPQPAESVEVQLLTIGRSENGTEVARFRFTWSFKRRK